MKPADAGCILRCLLGKAYRDFFNIISIRAEKGVDWMSYTAQSPMGRRPNAVEVMGCPGRGIC